MGTDTTEGDGLPCFSDIIHEDPIRKATVVAMVVPDAYCMLFSDAFEGMFGIDGFLGGQGLVQVHVCETTHMISEHTDTTVDWLLVAPLRSGQSQELGIPIGQC